MPPKPSPKDREAQAMYLASSYQSPASKKFLFGIRGVHMHRQIVRTLYIIYGEYWFENTLPSRCTSCWGAGSAFLLYQGSSLCTHWPQTFLMSTSCISCIICPVNGEKLSVSLCNADFTVIIMLLSNWSTVWAKHREGETIRTYIFGVLKTY